MNSINFQQKIVNIEQGLSSVSDKILKFNLLTQLIDFYSINNIKKARHYLDLQKMILNETDSVKHNIYHAVNAAFVENQHYNYFLSESLYSYAIELLEDSDESVDYKIDVYLDYAATCLNADRIEQSENFIRKAARLLEAFPNPVLKARFIVRQGYNLMNQTNYSKAIYQFLEAEDIFTLQEDDLQFKDFYFLSLIYSGLGYVYRVTEEYNRSILSYRQAVNICEITGIKTRIAFHYLSLGNAYMAIDDIDNAENFFQQAINTMDDISQNARAGAYANLGQCFFLRQDFIEARKLYKKARRLYHSMSENDYLNFSRIEVYLGELSIAALKYKRAQEHLGEALEFANLSEKRSQIASVCKQMSLLFARKNNYKEAYKYQEAYILHLAMHNEEVKSEQIVELQMQFEGEKRDQEADLLRMRATQLQHKALRAQMNPHFMFNVLNAIQRYINDGNIDEANFYLTKFADLMRDSLNYSDEEVISLESELAFLGDYLSLNQKMRFNGKMQFDIKVDDEIEPDIFGVPSMIIQPYVENSLEHGIKSLKNGRILIEFTLFDDNNLLCIIEDNGVGREKARELKAVMQSNDMKPKHRSMGTQITQDRLKILHLSTDIDGFVQTLDLEDDDGSPLGTRVEIIIPIMEVKRM
jgi:sensor histidine kinase YesM